MSGWEEVAPGAWRHRPLWKRVANALLRFLQTRRRPARLLVVYTRTHKDDFADPPTILGYGVGRVLHL